MRVNKTILILLVFILEFVYVIRSLHQVNCISTLELNNSKKVDIDDSFRKSRHCHYYKRRGLRNKRKKHEQYLNSEFVLQEAPNNTTIISTDSNNSTSHPISKLLQQILENKLLEFNRESEIENNFSNENLITENVNSQTTLSNEQLSDNTVLNSVYKLMLIPLQSSLNKFGNNSVTTHQSLENNLLATESSVLETDDCTENFTLLPCNSKITEVPISSKDCIDGVPVTSNLTSFFTTQFFSECTESNKIETTDNKRYISNHSDDCYSKFCTEKTTNTKCTADINNNKNIQQHFGILTDLPNILTQSEDNNSNVFKSLQATFQASHEELSITKTPKLTTARNLQNITKYHEESHSFRLFTFHNFMPKKSTLIESQTYKIPNEQEEELKPYDESEEIKNYVIHASKVAEIVNSKNMLAQWEFKINMNKFTRRQALISSIELINFQRTLNRNLKPLSAFDTHDDRITREIELLNNPTAFCLSDSKIAEFEEIIFKMEKIFSTISIPACNNQRIKFQREKDISQIMATSQNSEELKYYWIAWRDASGKKIRGYFRKYVDLFNLAASINKFPDAGYFWVRTYETEDLMKLIGAYWEDVRPLYQELHAYVRFKLKQIYKNVLNSTLIPSHLTGDVLSQSWKNIFCLVIPYPNSKIKVLDLKSKNFTVETMLQKVEEFFEILGFPKLPESFHKNSIFVEKSPLMSCEPSAWDMCTRNDYRIKMCAKATYENLLEMYHEMTHIHYYVQYQNLTFPFRNSPNPAFHEAFAGAVLLSVQTNKYLDSLELIENYNKCTDTTINFLMMMALEHIAFLPYSYVLDLWRLRIFSGDIRSYEYNEKFWELVQRYQGLEPPVIRTEDDFDGGAKYHVAANKPFLQHFLSTILQFQIHEALCKNGCGNIDNNELYDCVISDIPNAGNHLKSAMRLGASEEWRIVLKVLTGSRSIDTGPLLKYFQPLYNWLKLQNKKNNVKIGWNEFEELKYFRNCKKFYN